jgi:hypothetical protein
LIPISQRGADSIGKSSVVYEVVWFARGKQSGKLNSPSQAPVQTLRLSVGDACLAEKYGPTGGIPLTFRLSGLVLQIEVMAMRMLSLLQLLE